MIKLSSFFRKAILFSTVTIVLGAPASPQTLDPNPSLDVVMGHLERAQAFADKSLYPSSVNIDGTTKRVSSSNWTSGFFPGSLWLMYEYTKDPTWKTRAEEWIVALEGQKNNTSTHDIGFILNSSFGEGYRLTGNEKYKEILLQGAKSLSTRFNPIVGCIKSWDKEEYHFPVIIDNMINLEILFQATKISGDSSYYKIAVKHALTTMAHHFRRDNSSYHLVDYNPTNGSVIAKLTVQGLNNSSDWARGQSWGLYGFTMCYRETGDVRFLNMAKKIADFYITYPAMPKDFVPFWDFMASDYRDASAATIAASALLELSQFVPEKRSEYYNYGINILKSLSSPRYTAPVGTNNNFVLKHSVGNKPKNLSVDKPLNYADYYFIEALLRHKKPAAIVKATGGNNQISLRWNASTGATYYSVERSSVSGGPYTTVASNIVNTKYTNYGLTTGKTYYYKVISWNSVGEGGTSVETRATTNRPPIVTITSPTNDSIYTEPASITIKASASDLDGTISKVKFYNGSTYLKTVFSAPYTYTLSNLSSGTYSFTAKATDNKGAQAISGRVTVTVNKAPFVSIISPVNNTVYTAPATITVKAAASDDDGSISSVKFYNGSTYLKTVFTSPYTYALSDMPPGTYSLIAKATDNNGAQTKSAPVIIKVILPKTAIVMENKRSENYKTDISNSEGLNLRPNPATNILYVYSNAFLKNTNLVISVISSSGQVVKTVTSNNSAPAIQLDVSSLVNGVYTVRVIGGNKIFHKQFVKL